jgi:hypothetical protein
MSVTIETGLTLHKSTDGHKLAISAPSVTATSTILVSLEKPSEPLEETVIVWSREPGTGFTAAVAAGGAESHINWAVIN